MEGGRALLQAAKGLVAGRRRWVDYVDGWEDVVASHALRALVGVAAFERAMAIDLVVAATWSETTDHRFVAAWLTGSIARGEADALSDLDLHLVVTDEAATTLCARPWTHAGYTTAERAALFARFGQPAIVLENQNNAPPEGSWTCVIYASLLTVDWVLAPQASTARPPSASLLFDRAGIPLQQPPPPLSVAQRAARASERVAFFWMMMSIAVKHLLRGDAVRVTFDLHGLEPLMREIEALVTGVPVPYTIRSTFPLPLTVAEQVAVVRRFCAAILSLSADLVALGGAVPDQPMAIIDGLLASAAITGDSRGEQRQREDGA